MSDDDLQQWFDKRIRALLGEEARWRYFQSANGPMFVWTVEPFNLRNKDDVAQGRYESCVYEPYGKGSRSGKAQHWRKVDSLTSLHDLRRDAKARALRMFREWKETGRLPK